MDKEIIRNKIKEMEQNLADVQPVAIVGITGILPTEKAYYKGYLQALEWVLNEKRGTMSEYCKNCEALQQENEKLKEDYKRIIKINHTLAEEHKTIGNDLYSEIKSYRVELQAEKEKVKELEKELELNTANAVVIDYTTRLQEYKQALDEIEKILRDAHRFNTYCEDDRTQTDVRAFNNERILTVLDIISKAKGKINEKNNRENLL
nr:MAG TPA: hypothetical protein [Caudoviricetes sp.]